MTIELLKFLWLSVWPVLILWIMFFVFWNKKWKKDNKNPLLDNKENKWQM